MGWFDDLFGDAGEDEAKEREPRDPLGRLRPEPAFDAFRSAWKAGTSLAELFGIPPVTLKQPVGADAPNRRPDVAKVETFLDRTGHLDLGKTDGPTGYYGSRFDQAIRDFQKDNALHIDGLINPSGPTLQRIGAALIDNGTIDAQNTSSLVVESTHVVGRQASQSPSGGASSGVSNTPSDSVLNLLSNFSDTFTSSLVPSTGANHPTSMSTRSSVTLSKNADPDRAPKQSPSASEPLRLRPAMDKIEAINRRRVDALRQSHNPVAADNLEHFMDGSGTPRVLPRAEAIKLEPIKEGEIANINRFEKDTFRGDSEGNKDVWQLKSLRDGGKLSFDEYWDYDINAQRFFGNLLFGDRDFALGIGRAKFRSNGKFQAERKGDRIIINGNITHAMDDPYDFDPGQPGADGALALQKYRGAKPFRVVTRWYQPVKATVPVTQNGLGKPSVEWGKITE